MGEQHRVAGARALLQQDTARALTMALAGRAGLLCLDDAVVALGLHLGAFAASTSDGEEARQGLLARVFAVAQRAGEVGARAGTEAAS